jgi:hypothetical protein
MVHVHGHGQCARCGTSVEACCTGAGDEVEEEDGVLQPIDPRLFGRLFEHLGGPRATVTRESLVQALAHRLGVSLDEAQDVLETGAQLGLVVLHGDVVRLSA